MQIKDIRPETKERARHFIENLSCDVYIIGSNKYGIAVQNWLSSLDVKILGYINDYEKKEKFNDVSIVKSNHNFEGTVIVNCVVEGRTIDVQKLINTTNALKSIDYFALQFAFPEILFPVDFLNNTDSILKNKLEYNKIYSLLEDDKSKSEFESLINFRLNRDISFMNNFECRLNEQYFEEFIEMPSCPSFIDGGGFDGSTSIEFIRNYPDYSGIYYFEPTESSMIASLSKLKFNDRIAFYQKGLWSENKKVYFDNSLGSASKISETGNNYIETISIDEVIAEKVDFIKLDIEGAEIEALKGAKNVIKKLKPIMAVCIYHNQSDFVEIPKLILDYNPNYKIYLRHYTQGVFETVMYFV